jgi:hypothetical protein
MPRSRSFLGCGGFRFQGSFAIASDHNHAEKGANNGGAKEKKYNWDADGPDAWREEFVQRMIIIDEWLQTQTPVSHASRRAETVMTVRTIKSVHMV